MEEARDESQGAEVEGPAGGIVLTWSEDTEILESHLQQEACRGICQDIIIAQLGCDEFSHTSTDITDITLSQPKRSPLVVVHREESLRRQQPAPVRTRRSFRKTKSKGVPSSPTSVEEVDLVFVDHDKESGVLGIEVCSSPSDKISDLHELQRATASY